MNSRRSGFSGSVGGSFTARDDAASDQKRIAVPMRTRGFKGGVARPEDHAYTMKEMLRISGTGTGTETGTGARTCRAWRNGR